MVREEKLESKILEIRRTTRVTEGGKKFSFRAVVVVGDKEGGVGVGVAKGVDVAQAVEKATRRAKKLMIKVPLYEGTIPHQVEAKYGPAKIIIKPQKKGRGIIAGGVARVIFEKAGIKDISSKYLERTHNKINNARVVIAALQKLKKKNSENAVS